MNEVLLAQPRRVWPRSADEARPSANLRPLTGAAGWVLFSLLAVGCASDQRRLVRLQNERAYLVNRQVEACSVKAPAINCNVSADLLDAMKRHEAEAIDSSARACNGPTSAACATHGMFRDVLGLLKRDAKTVRKAGVR